MFSPSKSETVFRPGSLNACRSFQGLGDFLDTRRCLSFYVSKKGSARNLQAFSTNPCMKFGLVSYFMTPVGFLPVSLCYQRPTATLELRVQAGIIVVACSQCARGTVEIDKYAVGRAFADKGVRALAPGREVTITCG